MLDISFEFILTTSHSQLLRLSPASWLQSLLKYVVFETNGQSTLPSVGGHVPIEARRHGKPSQPLSSANKALAAWPASLVQIASAPPMPPKFMECFSLVRKILGLANKAGSTVVVVVVGDVGGAKAAIISSVGAERPETASLVPAPLPKSAVHT